MLFNFQREIMTNNTNTTVGLAQVSPIWLDKIATLAKINQSIKIAADKHCSLVVFSEALLPGYPFWLDFTNGAQFNSPFQKSLYAHYVSQSVDLQKDELSSVLETCKKNNIACVLGLIEKSNSGHSVYCSLVYINQSGEIKSVHRKLMPTYEERLVWAQGDGHGLVTHPLGPFTVGALNCWENWMPLARTSLYAQGEDLHIAIWPGSINNTQDITRFIAKESRSYVVSVSSVFNAEQIQPIIPELETVKQNAPDILANGGSCVANPDGSWLLEPVVNEEGVFTVEIDHQRVREERQNFDPCGHYSRPDVTQLTVDKTRRNILN